MSSNTVINHEGTTCLLKTPVEENGYIYPFAMDAFFPERKRWAYRLLSTEEDELTDDGLKALLNGEPPKLNAKWDEVPTCKIGWITIYLRNPDGSIEERYEEIDQGPEMLPPEIAREIPPLEPVDSPSELADPNQEKESVGKDSYDPFDDL